jgi:hypothetical protein
MKHTNNDCHRKAEHLLRSAGWTPLRQFEPAKADRIKDGECFEMWRNEVGNRRVIVHFYADGDGCDFYACGNENTWSSVEELLKEPGK